jgi:hypothetical protein
VVTFGTMSVKFQTGLCLCLHTSPSGILDETQVWVTQKQYIFELLSSAPELSLRLPKHHAMKTLGGVVVQLHGLLTSVLDENLNSRLKTTTSASSKSTEKNGPVHRGWQKW